jgi:hypothetical protein
METQIHDYEIWDLKNSISQFILPRLRLFVKKVENDEFLALPTWVNDDDSNVKLNEEELKDLWIEILNEMIIPFDFNVNPDKYSHIDHIEINHLNKKGLELFSKYFQHLWD